MTGIVKIMKERHVKGHLVTVIRGKMARNYKNVTKRRDVTLNMKRDTFAYLTTHFCVRSNIRHM